MSEDINYGEPLILEDINKLKTVTLDKDNTVDLDYITSCLKEDFVVLVKQANKNIAENVLSSVAEYFGLLDNLKVQSAFASILGHRKNEGQYYMTVNNREGFQYIPSHSEGTSNTNMQLASMYCQENSTNGGLTILSNVDQSSDVWQSLGEYCVKVKLTGQKPTSQQLEIAKAYLKVDLLADTLTLEDQVIDELDTSKLPMLKGLNFKAFHVISKPRKIFSNILNRELYSYWDSIASHDYSSGTGYYNLLKQEGLLIEPEGGASMEKLDNAADRRVWSSGVDFGKIFTSKLTYKLRPGELILFNNLTWTHSSTNWEPNKGTRKVFVAFA